MKITKFDHSCLLVEMPEPVNRTALFDPGVMSEAVLDVDSLEFLDDIIITHGHGDHYSPKLLTALTNKFPKVRITTTSEVAAALIEQGITTAITTEPSPGIVFFAAPHESVQPLFPQPQEIGVHYLDTLTHPGDSHSFQETKAILALPMTGPWGATTTAVNLAIKLQPRYVLPIHDWHWNDAARQQMYDNVAQALQKEGIEFIKLESAQPVIINT